MMTMRMTTSGGRRGGRLARGFTLIELLLAIAIVAVLAGALFQTIFSAFKAKSTAENAMEPGSRAGIAMEFLGRDFASTLMPAGDVTTQTPAPGATATATPTQPLPYEFQGIDNSDGTADADDVWFYAATDTPMIPYGGPTQVQNGGNTGGATGGMMSQSFGKDTAGLNNGEALNTDIRRVEYTVEQIDGVNCLVRRVNSNLLADQEPDLDTEMEVLCRDVRGFNVEYFDGTDWQTSWDSTATDPANMIPVAVRITLELYPPGGQTPRGDFKRIVKVVSLACYVDLTVTNASTAGTGN
jgi:prepilin-type N-terminal cleavage/methylation domain-containing protein